MICQGAWSSLGASPNPPKNQRHCASGSSPISNHDISRQTFEPFKYIRLQHPLLQPKKSSVISCSLASVISYTNCPPFPSSAASSPRGAHTPETWPPPKKKRRRSSTTTPSPSLASPTARIAGSQSSFSASWGPNTRSLSWIRLVRN